MKTLHSALDNVVLGQAASKGVLTQSIQEVPLSQERCWEKCCQAFLDRLCVILFLPIGVVMHRGGQGVRAATVIMCVALWAACLYTSVTGGWNMGGCLLLVFEATANLALLSRKSSSIRFQEFNAYVMEAMQSHNMGPLPAMKWHLLVITACLAGWILCHVAKVRLVAWAGGEMTWQVVVLPCFQNLYRASWSLWLLRLNEFVNELADAFCRSCARSPEGVDSAYSHWACVCAFTGQMTQHCQVVYVIMFLTALMSGLAPIVEIFVSTSLSSQSEEWILPHLIASIIAFALMTYVFGCAAAMSEKCKKAASFVNYLQGCLCGQARAEIRWLVSYMESSDAGIFLGGSKLDLFWYSRFRYLAFSASVFLAVRFQTLPEAHKGQLAEQWGRFLRALALWD